MDNTQEKDDELFKLKFKLWGGKIVYRKVEKKICFVSETLKNLINDCNSSNNEDIPIFIECFTNEKQIDILLDLMKYLSTPESDSFKYAVKNTKSYLYTNKDINNYLIDTNVYDHQALFIITNFLDIEPLMDYFSIKIANSIKKNYLLSKYKVNFAMMNDNN